MASERTPRKKSTRTAKKRSKKSRASGQDGSNIEEEPQYGLGEDEEAVDEDQQQSMETESEDSQDSELALDTPENREEGPPPLEQEVTPPQPVLQPEPAPGFMSRFSGMFSGKSKTEPQSPEQPQQPAAVQEAEPGPIQAPEAMEPMQSGLAGEPAAAEAQVAQPEVQKSRFGGFFSRKPKADQPLQAPEPVQSVPAQPEEVTAPAPMEAEPQPIEEAPPQETPQEIIQTQEAPPEMTAVMEQQPEPVPAEHHRSRFGRFFSRRGRGPSTRESSSIAGRGKCLCPCPCDCAGRRGDAQRASGGGRRGRGSSDPAGGP